MDRSWLRHSAAWREAVTATCERYGVTEELLLGRRQQRSLCDARAHCYTLLRAHGWGYPDIGAAFGRDHAAILRAVRRLCANCVSRPEVVGLVESNAADCAAWKVALG